VADARLMGADAVLLIVAALGADELRRFFDLATELGLDALVEVHDEGELDLPSHSREPGRVNQRDLVTFAVDTERAERLAAAIPEGVTAVAESGIAGGADAARLGRWATTRCSSASTSCEPATRRRRARTGWSAGRLPPGAQAGAGR